MAKTLQVGSLGELFAKRKNDIEKVLPQHLTAERVMRIAWTLIRRTPKLSQCNAESLVESVVRASTLGLELGLEAHLVPFGNDCVMIPDFKGLVALAKRSGTIKKVVARTVMKQDIFNVTYGTTDEIVHVPDLAIDRTKLDDMVAWYAVATFADGTTQPEIMTKAEVEMVKAKSKSPTGPWSDKQSYPEMAKKTVVKRLCKLLPQSPELATAVELDNRYESGGDRSVVTIFDDEEETNEYVAKQTKQGLENLKEKLSKAEDQGEAEVVDEEKKEEKKKGKGKETEAVPTQAAPAQEQPPLAEEDDFPGDKKPWR